MSPQMKCAYIVTQTFSRRSLSNEDITHVLKDVSWRVVYKNKEQKLSEQYNQYDDDSHSLGYSFTAACHPPLSHSLYHLETFSTCEDSGTPAPQRAAPGTLTWRAQQPEPRRCVPGARRQQNQAQTVTVPGLPAACSLAQRDAF
ncbi:uncharacterized protein LOC123791028 isoform X2 [Ursus americanus]|uniref:uncharacterized protein LOC123791028 isoform X2 n=1 Tax=Ursus americanus TaxID=9643 RepID=UPI001E67DF06|nr:uncharacterized protein LOC123791028 isoform X2 [Ursus americanus]